MLDLFKRCRVSFSKQLLSQILRNILQLQLPAAYSKTAFNFLIEPRLIHHIQFYFWFAPNWISLSLASSQQPRFYFVVHLHQFQIPTLRLSPVSLPVSFCISFFFIFLCIRFNSKVFLNPPFALDTFLSSSQRSLFFSLLPFISSCQSA